MKPQFSHINIHGRIETCVVTAADQTIYWVGLLLLPLTSHCSSLISTVFCFVIGQSGSLLYLKLLHLIAVLCTGDFSVAQAQASSFTFL